MTSAKEFLKSFQRFSLHNINASALLFTAAILAMFLANSPWAYFYEDFLSRQVILQIGDYNLFSHHGSPMSVLAFVNDALMALFFLLVGMEIKQEILIGELSSIRKAIFPIVAAFGGMIIPIRISCFISMPTKRKKQCHQCIVYKCEDRHGASMM
jgi:NhaA family Na+:H+ antiporter